MASSSDKLVPQAPSEEFVQLFTRSQRALYLFILAQVGDVNSAEEILQETNLVIWNKMHQFALDTNFLSWARQIAKFEVLKHRQRYRREKLTFSEAFVNVVADEMVQISGEQERRREALQHCLGKLQESDRLLIQQRYQPGNSGRDLADKIGRPANSVYQSLGRIRRALLDCIHRQMATEMGT